MNGTGQDSIQSSAFVISTFVAVGLCLGLGWNCGSHDLDYGLRWPELEDRINPNRASAESIARLPGLGPSRAGAIVAYRESSGRKPAFRNDNDLQKVSGIGPETVLDISGWIEFE